jgi:hypothetical protein
MLEILFQNEFDLGAADDCRIDLALRDSIRRENVTVARYFLDRGFTLLPDNMLPGSISHAACLESPKSPTETLLDMLLGSGADINGRDKHGRTCI